MSFLRVLLFFLFILVASVSMAQQHASLGGQVLLSPLDPSISQQFIRIGDSIFIYLGNCKNNGKFLFHNQVDKKPQREPVIVTAEDKKIPFLKIHGNILYNSSYRSFIDTPFAQNDLMQHSVQTSFNFTLKEKYPVRMTIRNRNSNSPYFKNTTDVNVEFSRRQLLDNIKTDLKSKAAQLVKVDALAIAEQHYQNRLTYKQKLQGWLNSPARAQELVEEKEKTLKANIPSVDPKLINPKVLIQDEIDKQTLDGIYNFSQSKGSKGVNNFSISGIKQYVGDTLKNLTDNHKPVGKDSSYFEKYNNKKKELVELESSLKKEEANLKQVRKKVQDSISSIKKEINGISNSTGLYAFMKKKGMAKNELTKAQRLLLSINKIGIGRSWVDYSELTVRNVSIAGINVEMNPMPYYVAFAVGKVNYRFRDFIIKDKKELPDQSLYIIRAGIGQKEKNNFIVTFYNGKKAILNYSASNSPSSVQRVLGISAEARYALNENNYLIAEIAKSSYNNNSNLQPPSSDLIGKAFNLKVHTNEAYSIKLFSKYPATETKFTASYKKIGENFQSFNLSPINVNQDAWMARVNQFFWKKRFVLDAAIRKNDFESPIAALSGYSAKTVFKSLQATLRIPKYPFVSVGYYPSSQLSLSNNNVLMENQYNTFNLIAGHSYRVKKIAMNSNAVYTKFYNSSNDTGFIYFNAGSYTLNHSIFLSKFTLQTSIGVTDQQDLHLFTLEQQLRYQFKNKLTLSGGLKWTQLNKIENLIGSTAGMSIFLKKLGTIQMNYDKTYLPGYNRALIPVDIGRLSFLREF